MSNTFPPSPEHEWLKKNTGKWLVECAYFMSSGADPVEVNGTEENDMLGDFWSVGRFQADVFGTPVEALSSIGFDPLKGRFVSTWQDSSTPFHYTFEGDLDKDNQALQFEGENYDPVRQRRAVYRSRIAFLSDDEKVLRLSVESEGTEIPVVEYRYRREPTGNP